jgi:signal peptide peptidase SppA
MMDDISGPGSCSTQMLVSALRAAETDDSVGQILIDFSSPGGSVYGVQEAASEIARINAIKPIVGIANSMCASAAYWLMSQCSEAYCTPGGEVGSIGVWQAHEDVSKAMDDAGVKVTLVSAGKFKVEGNPYAPLDPEALQFMQQRTDDYYQAFTKAVAKGRGVPVATARDAMGQGRVYGADQALSAGMVDGIMDFDSLVKKMQKGAKATRTQSAVEIIPEITAQAPTESIVATPAAESIAPAQAAAQVEVPEAAHPKLSRLAAMQREIEILS